METGNKFGTCTYQITWKKTWHFLQYISQYAAYYKHQDWPGKLI